MHSNSIFHWVKMNHLPFFIFLMLFIFSLHVKSQDDYHLSGNVMDNQSGETLIGATVLCKTNGNVSLSNTYGFYTLNVPKGNIDIVISYLGYETLYITLQLSDDISKDFRLKPAEFNLDEVVVTGESGEERMKNAQMGVEKLEIKQIRQIPALMGEVDVLKAIQLLPGVQSVSEGSSGFSVRGGSPDQNLILLDEALVYNPSHLMGFFSVFNNDAVKGVELFKGDIPAQYGGRLSSVVDVRMNDGNTEEFSGRGGVGTVSSRLTLEGPISKGKSSFMVSGRRTYADLFLLLSKDEKLKGNTLYFYDLNAKANLVIDDRNRIFVSGYFGQDVFKNDDFGMGWGNQTMTFRWNHLYSPVLFSNVSLIYSRFNYGLGIPDNQPNAFEWTSAMRDIGVKADFTWFTSSRSNLKFGMNLIHHLFEPGTAEGKGSETAFGKVQVPDNLALESAFYVSHEQKIGGRLNLKYGLRFSTFSNLGPGTLYHYDVDYQKNDSTVYTGNSIYHTYSAFEPRLSFSYVLNEKSSIKGAYTRNVQYIHLAQNSTAGTPLDIWFASSPNVEPQKGDQFSLGYFRYHPKLQLESSIEGFYKLNHNAIDFKDHAELLLNQYIDGELRFGEAKSQGLEFMLKKPDGRINGWIAYTWSRTFRQIKEINQGDRYPASYDRPHDISIVVNADISKRLTVGATWVYSTGSPVTFPTGRFVIGNTIAPVYSDRNSYRLPDYHRLDLSVTLRNKQKANRKWHGEWNLSAYNAYYRKNPWVINFVADPDQPNVTRAEMTYLFGIVPALTYNFHF